MIVPFLVCPVYGIGHRTKYRGKRRLSHTRGGYLVFHEIHFNIPGGLVVTYHAVGIKISYYIETTSKEKVTLILPTVLYSLFIQLVFEGIYQADIPVKSLHGDL